jgi:hypothetical protein
MAWKNTDNFKAEQATVNTGQYETGNISDQTGSGFIQA